MDVGVGCGGVINCPILCPHSVSLLRIFFAAVFWGIHLCH